jgi:hypothetical protein
VLGRHRSRSAPVPIHDVFADGLQLGDYFHDAHGVPDQHRIEEKAQTTGIADVVELFKRNEPLFGVSRSVSQPRLIKVNATNSAGDEDFDVGQCRISER